MSHITIYNKETRAVASFEAEVNIPKTIADEPRDYTQPGEWEPKPIQLTGTCYLEDATPIVSMMKKWRERDRKNLKQLLWLITHGYTAHFKFIVKDKRGRMHSEFYYVDRPRMLKLLIRSIRVIPQYIVVDRHNDAYEIRHGKLKYYGSVLYHPNPNWEKLYNGNEDLTRDTKLILKAMKVDPRLYE